MSETAANATPAFHVDAFGCEVDPSQKVLGLSLWQRAAFRAKDAGASTLVVHAPKDTAVPDLSAIVEDVKVVHEAADATTAAVRVDEVNGERVTDRKSKRAAEWRLLQACRRPYDGLADRFLLRSFSLRISWLLAKTPITPNQVTFANIAVGGFAVWAAWMGGLLWGTLAGGFILLQVILDSCDGELARVKRLQSRFGMILDNASDDVIDMAFVLAAALSLGGEWQTLGIVATGARLWVSLLIFWTVSKMGKHGDVMAFSWWFDNTDESLSERYTGEAAPMTALQVIRSFARRDTYVLSWAILCFAQLPQAVVVYGAVIGCGYGVLGLIHTAVTATRRS